MNSTQYSDENKQNRPRDFWRTATAGAELAEPLTAEEIARATDAVNFTLIAFGVPDRFRQFLDALIGASGGSLDWFDAADIEIAQRGREVTSQALKDKSLARWTLRFREEFAEWERSRGLTLVEFMPGGQDKGQNYKSRYRITTLLTAAIETDRRARESIRFERNPKRELRKAAATVYAEFSARNQATPIKSRFKKSSQDCDTYLKLISTYLEKLCGRALIERKNLAELLETIEFTVRQRRLEVSNSAHFSNSTQVEPDQEDRESRRGDSLSPRNYAENGAGKRAARAERDSCVDKPAPEDFEAAAPDEVLALAAFRSVGCENFEWFYLTDESKNQGVYHRTTGESLAEEISDIVLDAERGGDSCIVRVRGLVLQLDDCEGVTASLLSPFALATFETSRSNYQVWLAFNEPEDKAAVQERIFAGVRSVIPSSINPGAGGAIRWPGSINYKPGRNAWRVRVHSLNPGRFVTPSELEDAGLLADPQRTDYDWQTDGAPGDWPDYKRCVESKTENGVCDRSRADAQFVYFALKRHRTPEEIAAKLREVSERARESGQKYVERTIAAEARYLGLEVMR